MAACSLLLPAAHAGEEASLRLIPFPKEVTVATGDFALARRLILELPAGQSALLAEQLVAEFKLANLQAPTLRTLKRPAHTVRLSARGRGAPKALALRPNATPEDYALRIDRDAVTMSSPDAAGLFYGVQTLRQLIRANRRADALPCLTIRDWPSIRWRAFQDDLPRGPSSTFDNLKLQAALGSFFKQNVWTYYMEYQFAFAKHSVIGPKNGSLPPPELKALVDFAKPLHLDVLGNQQSFGHFTAILAHPEFKDLRETEYLLNPTNEKTYALLDELYSEVIPLLPLGFFNVCCDETWGLGTGPSKPVAEKIGVGALYVRHIQRLHALVHGKHGKRMMMWGDIILNHADKLKDIPKDVVMLTWGYDPRASFEDQIVPFAKSGYEFWVCPGVNCWSRVLPHFGNATTNIWHFVRDGTKHGATGVLNTAWDDDGENFNAPNWHGIAWGAECAWNASTTSPRDFNRRIGAVLFGESGAHFGQAIEALMTSGLDGLPNAAFWKIDFGPRKVASVTAERARLEKQLQSVREAIAHFEACQREAKLNGGLLDFFVFGARRMELSAQRELDHLEAALAYRDATKAERDQAVALITKAEAALRRARDAHDALGKRFAELWARENKPYALEWTLTRYTAALKKYDAVLDRLAYARSTARVGHLVPAPQDLGLDLVEQGPSK